MTSRPTEQLIQLLSNSAKPVAPLAPPLVRAGKTLFVMAFLGSLAFVLLSESNPLRARGPGGEVLAGIEMLAMLATGLLSVTAAFFVSVPGRSRSWLAAPLAPLVAWLLLSGAGCYRDFIRTGPDGWQLGHSMDCLFFIVGASLLLGAPLIWNLSRSRPIEPLPVAVLGGLGTAALAAFLLQFFHPFTVTFLDLAVHILAIVIVVALTTLLKRPMLLPA